MSLLLVCQQVDSRKAAAKQVYQVQNTLIEKKGHSDRSAESRTPRRKVQEEEKLMGFGERSGSTPLGSVAGSRVPTLWSLRTPASVCALGKSLLV